MSDRQGDTTVRMTPEAALTQVHQSRAVLIDVRDPQEYAREHIAGALSLPLADLTAEQIPDGTTAILYCGAGKRACAAAQRLLESGVHDVAVVEGGIACWKAAGLPTNRSAADDCQGDGPSDPSGPG